MSERFDHCLVDAEEQGFSLVELNGLVAILEHPKGRTQTWYLEEHGGVLYVARARSGRHELPGPNHL
jgi:hypothetical protein